MDLLLDPNIAYFLLVIGFLLAFLAILTPGTGILEVGALFALVIAGWAVYNLPVNYWALAVLVLGVIAFLLAVRRSGQYGYLIASIAALVIGSLFIFRGEGWQPVVNPAFAVAVSLLSGGFLWLIATKTLEATLERPVHDLQGLIGAIGEARTDVHQEGSVYAQGEMWSARSEHLISAGKPVRILRRDGFILEIEAVEDEEELP